MIVLYRHFTFQQIHEQRVLLQPGAATRHSGQGEHYDDAVDAKHSIYPPLQQCPPSISFSLLASLGPETSTAKLAIGVESCTDLPGRDYGEQHQLAGGTVMTVYVVSNQAEH